MGLIAAQVSAGAAATTAGAAAPAMSALQATDNVLYLRFPGLQLRTGQVPLYRFKNGTASLAPMLDHRYELSLGEQPFAFTVRNCFKGRGGASFGYGAQYCVGVGGQQYHCSLPEFGRNPGSTPSAISTAMANPTS